MAFREFYRQDAGRYLEVVCGLALGAFAALAGVLTAIIAARGYRQLGPLVVASFLALISWGLFRVSIRLVRGQSRIEHTLLSPIAILGGAIVFLLGGVLLVGHGVAERDVRPLLAGIGSFPAAYFAWKLAMERWRVRALPNKSFERTRGP